MRWKLSCASALLPYAPHRQGWARLSTRVLLGAFNIGPSWFAVVQVPSMVGVFSVKYQDKVTLYQPPQFLSVWPDQHMRHRDCQLQNEKNARVHWPVDLNMQHAICIRWTQSWFLPILPADIGFFLTLSPFLSWVGWYSLGHQKTLWCWVIRIPRYTAGICTRKWRPKVPLSVFLFISLLFKPFCGLCWLP